MDENKLTVAEAVSIVSQALFPRAPQPPPKQNTPCRSDVIKKKWLRHQYRLSGSISSFKEWARKQAADDILKHADRNMVGPTKAVARLLKTQMGATSRRRQEVYENARDAKRAKRGYSPAAKAVTLAADKSGKKGKGSARNAA